MLVRSLSIFLLGVLLARGLLAQQHGTTVKPGSSVFVTMTGELAKEYAKRTGLYADGKFPSGFRVETIAVIEQVLNDGQLLIEHSVEVGPRELVKSSGSEPKSNRLTGSPTKLLTLSGTIDTKRVKAESLPVATLQSNDPNSKPESSIAESGSLRLELADLKGLRLRIWTLSEEIGQ